MTTIHKCETKAEEYFYDVKNEIITGNYPSGEKYHILDINDGEYSIRIEYCHYCGVKL